jgi:pyruvate kinase
MKLNKQKTKIVCTIGPASSDPETLQKLLKSGMNIARLNFSHGDLETYRSYIQNIRSASEKTDKLCAILADLPGPKIRIGELEEEPLNLEAGKEIILTTENVKGTREKIHVNYDKLLRSVSTGSLIFINDGFIQLRVEAIKGKNVTCKVLIGGQISSRKGVNIPDSKLYLDTITKRDLEILDFCLEQNINIFGVSFVKSADCIRKVKEYSYEKGFDIYTIAKIECAEALKNIDEILDAADAVMIARGDLGVQIRIEEVPVVQKELIHKANLLGVPVITATQMLESMIHNVRPTRAETTDVANAILDGTDAVMLSAETAVGDYPVETVRMMAKISDHTELRRKKLLFSPHFYRYFKDCLMKENLSIEDVISLDAIEAVNALDVSFILTPTTSGSTARRISRFKPDCWTLAFTRNEKTREFLQFSYGVHPFLIDPGEAGWEDTIMTFLQKNGLVNKSDKVIFTQGKTPGIVGGTDSLRILEIS